MLKLWIIYSRAYLLLFFLIHQTYSNSFHFYHLSAVIAIIFIPDNSLAMSIQVLVFGGGRQNFTIIIISVSERISFRFRIAFINAAATHFSWIFTLQCQCRRNIIIFDQEESIQCFSCIFLCWGKDKKERKENILASDEGK